MDRKIIDNEPTVYRLDKYTMVSAIKDIIEQKNPDTIDIAVGFFSLSGWKLLENHLPRCKFCRILVGWEVTSKKTIERKIQDWFSKELEEISIEEYAETRRYVHSLIAFLERENPSWSSLPEEKRQGNPASKYATHFKIHSSPHIHGKLYLFPDIAILGSSNFTYGGLTGNTELNIVVDDRERLNLLNSWFEHFFTLSKSKDYRSTLLKQLKNSMFGDKEYDPHWVYLKINFEYHKREIRRSIEDTDEVVKLAEFQHEGVARALEIIDEYGGVMIADAVGLGKSYMGVAILRTLAIRAPPLRNNILVVCPAQLRDEWQKHLDNAGLTTAIINTQELMSRKPIERKAFDIILVDESHNFRRPKPKRYTNFMNVLTRRDPKIILLTATPINISYFDLYYQLKLIFKNKDTALANSLSIPNLNEFFKGVEQGTADINLITEHLLVARSRSVIRYRQKVLKQDILLPSGKKIEFPERTLNRIDYQIIEDQKLLEDLSSDIFTSEFEEVKNKMLTQEQQEDEGLEENLQKSIKITPSTLFYEWIFRILQDWEGAPFKIESYKTESKQDEEVIRAYNSIIPLMTTTLLKRLESSIHSFKKSILTQIRFCVFAQVAIENGYIISSSAVNEIKKMISNEEDELEIDIDLFEPFDEFEDAFSQSMSENLLEEYWESFTNKLKVENSRKQKLKIIKIKRTDFTDESITKLKDAITKDEQLLQGVYKIADKVHKTSDFKLEALKNKIREIFSNATHYTESKVIIFTFYETTAKYLFDLIKEDNAFLQELGEPTIDTITGKITGSGKRRDIINRFAPVSSEVKIPEEDQISILISTDVLSEGQNLQDAKYVINYDLHWNPVRMIQRAGRIDRLGSLHSKVVICNFFLEDGLEELLNLMSRITLRLRRIDEAIELDAPVIEDPREYQNLKRIEGNDARVIDEYEEKLELIGLNQSIKDLHTALQEIGYEKFSKTPRGIHSGLLTLDHSGLMVSIEIVQERSRGSPTTIWCYEPDDPEKEFPGLDLPHGIIQNKHTVEKIIRCQKSTKRIVIEEPESLYKRAADIVRKIEDLTRQRVTASNMLQKLEAGNKKYYTLVNRGMKHWGLDRQLANRFMIFLKEKRFDNIKKDVQEIVDNLNKEFDKINETAKHLEEDTALNKWRKETLEEFLSSLYEYFDTHDILTKKELKERSRMSGKFRLIGILRLYTQETIKPLTSSQ